MRIVKNTTHLKFSIHAEQTRIMFDQSGLFGFIQKADQQY